MFTLIISSEKLKKKVDFFYFKKYCSLSSYEGLQSYVTFHGSENYKIPVTTIVLYFLDGQFSEVGYIFIIIALFLDILIYSTIPRMS
jgi:hypothetical protein